MGAFRALKRWIPVTAGVVGLTFAAPAAAYAESNGGTIPRLGRRVPGVGGDVGDVITTTCGNSAVIILAVVVCDTELPAAAGSSPVLAQTGRRATRPVRRSTRPARRSPRPSPVNRPQVEAIADSSGFDWRRAGVVFHTRFHPEECCAWGVYDYRDNSVWIGPTAFASPGRLRYTVLHELGHAWQWRSGRLDRLAADMAPFGHRGRMRRLEAGADCISVLWGASSKNAHYWTCPPAAQRLVARRLASDWQS